MDETGLFGQLPAVIKRLRRAAGQNQEDLAAALGVSRKSVSGYERGSISPPLEKLAAILTHTGIVGVELVKKDGTRIALGDCPTPEADHSSLKDLRLRIGLRLVEDVLGKELVEAALLEERKRALADGLI